jgi:glycosyltransferase involved in cell wall biosynthesis
MPADPRPDAPRVAFVIPAKNEAPTIARLLDDIERACAGETPFEVVYVDDGSSDQTQALLCDAMRARPYLRVLRHAQSCGKSAAIRSGSGRGRAPLVVTLDGDGQNDPAFVPAMIAILEADPRVALVAGQRSRRGDSGFKLLQSRIANRARKALLQDGTRDTACGLKAFRRDVFLALPYFDTMHRFLPALVAREGFAVAHLDVVDRPRLAGVSHYGLLDRLLVGIPDLFGVWWLIRRRKRVPQIEEVRS